MALIRKLGLGDKLLPGYSYRMGKLLGLLWLLCACNNSKTTTSNTDSLRANTTTVDSNVLHTEQVIRSLTTDNCAFLQKQVLRGFDTSVFNADTVTLTCYYDRNNMSLLKLVVREAMGVKASNYIENPVSEEQYMYDSTTRSVVYTFELVDYSSVQVVANNRKVYYYSRSIDGKGIQYLNYPDSFTAETKISAIIFLLDTYMQFFPKVTYAKILPSLNSLAVMKNFDSVAVMTERSNGRLISKFPPYSAFYYLDHSIDTSGSQTGIWYYVADTTQKIKGWIYDHDLSNISQLTDCDF